MTDESTLRNLPAALLKSRTAQVLLVLFALLESFNLFVIPAFINSEQAIAAKATAHNAALKQKAEADLAEQKSINETQVAANAARKQRADARKATADAEKSTAEAIIARENAANARERARAEAEAQLSEADIKNQLTVVETEIARQAARRQKTEADIAEIDAHNQQTGNELVQRALQR